MPTLNQSTGTLISSNVTAGQNRAIVRLGSGTVTTPGTTGYDVVATVASQNTAFANASTSSRIALGVGADDIEFRPLTYP